MKIAVNEITTLAVVLSPTPFAPPVVVVPQPHEITAMTAPNATALAVMMPKSLGSKYFAALSTITFGDTPYRKSANKIDAASDCAKEIMHNTGNEIAHAITRGITK